MPPAFVLYLLMVWKLVFSFSIELVRQNHTYTKHFNTMSAIATPTLVILDGNSDYIP
jgi:hypothetical protein